MPCQRPEFHDFHLSRSLALTAWSDHMANAQTDSPFYRPTWQQSQDGRCATWDVTVSDTVAASYVGMSSSCAASAAAKHKEDKYVGISPTHHFVPIAFETFGPINQVGTDFISSLGQRLTLISDDPRESSFLFQRLSVAFPTHSATCKISFLTSRDTP